MSVRVCKNSKCKKRFTISHGRQVFCTIKCTRFYHSHTKTAKIRKKRYMTLGKGQVTMKKWVSGNKDIVKLHQKKYSDSQIAKINRNKYAKNHPERMKAYILVRRRIPKNNPCSVKDCNIIKTHRHHPDYSKPLEIIYLCPQHHKDVHNKKLIFT